MTDPSLSVTLTHAGPIALLDLTESLVAIGQDYKRWADMTGADDASPGTRLYVREIRNGSVVVELVALANALMPAVEGARSLMAFASDLKSCFDYLRSATIERPETLDEKRADTLGKMVAPVAQHPGNNLTIRAGDNSSVNVTQVFIDSQAANAAQNKVRTIKEEAGAPVEGVHRKVLFYWHQVRDQVDGKGTGDRGIIESIESRPVKVRFEDDALKAPMLGEALFRMAYVVDVRAEAIRGRVALYTILHLHESFTRE